MTKKIDLRIPAIGDAFGARPFSGDYSRKLEGVTVIVTKTQTLYKTSSGMILAGCATNLYDGWNMNDTVRRAWCKLSGVKFVDLKAAIKAHKESRAQKKLEEAADSLKIKARRLGYRLVKV